MTLLFVISGNSVSAENTIDWGMKLSLKGELPGKWKGDNISINMFKPGMGISIGAVADIYLGKKFYFEPGTSLFYSSYYYKDLIIQGVDGTTDQRDPKLTKYGLEIPLLVGYMIDLSDRYEIDVFTGPQLRYAFAGKIDIKKEIINGDLNDSFDLWGINGQRRFDVSWKIGIGVPVKTCVLSLEADLGITDLLKNDISFRENRIGFSIIKFF